MAWTRLTGLPAQEWDDLHADYTSRIEHAKKMLEVLKKTRKGKYT